VIALDGLPAFGAGGGVTPSVPRTAPGSLKRAAVLPGDVVLALPAQDVDARW